MKFIEYESCICCGKTNRILISKIGRNRENLDTVICPGCGLIHSLPIPSKQELEFFYKDTYRTIYKSAFKPKLKHTIRYASSSIYHFKRMLNYIDSTKHQNFLDIGSGSGEILYFAKKSGFIVIGVEPNKGYASYCREELNLPIINETYERANLKNNGYDIIHINEVLEHMRDPIKTLKDVFSFLRPGGIAFINVPDIELEFHAPNTRFHYAHIFNFNHITIKSIIEKCGFEILNSDDNSTSIIARKNKLKNNNSIINIHKNFDHIYEKLVNNKKLPHYTSFTPYWRLIKKIFLYPKEIIQGKFFYKDSKSILDSVYKKGKADPLVRFFMYIDNYRMNRYFKSKNI